MITCTISANGATCSNRAVAMMNGRHPICLAHAADYWRPGQDVKVPTGEVKNPMAEKTS